ncbi:MAG: PaaI family thioesterase [Candidatus Binataceae bacterium]
MPHDSDINSSSNLRGEPTHFKSGTFPAPIGQLLGLRLTRVENRVAVVEFEADKRYANPMGTLHGGVLCDLTDAAMGIAYRTILAEDESFTTLVLKINFLRPVWKAKLHAKARVVRAGKVIGLVECDVDDEQDRLVARASSTCMRLRGELAEGRRPPPLSTNAQS